MNYMRLPIINNGNTNHVDDSEDSQYGSVLEEVNTLGEAEREDEEDRGGGHYEVPVEEPVIAEVVADQTVECSVELQQPQLDIMRGAG